MGMVRLWAASPPTVRGLVVHVLGLAAIVRRAILAAAAVQEAGVECCMKLFC